MNPYELAHAALEKKQYGTAERGLNAVLKKAPRHWRDLGQGARKPAAFRRGRGS
ncbi:MAG: hypothetical protein WDN30_08675 [Pararobbsia sp.]